MALRCLLAACLYLCCKSGDGLSLSASASNRTFMFVSGIPQSGTSLVQQIFAVTPMASTMVDKCFEKHGNKCSNWNNEGQWLLGWGQTEISKMSSSLLNAGSLCPLNPNTSASSSDSLNSKALAAFIREQWFSYWDAERSVLLVEKSPQNMLKIPLIRDIFNNDPNNQSSSSSKLKFLVVLKHPSTLNIALPKRTEWLYSLEYTGNDGERERVKKKLLPDKINKNFEFFIDFMDNLNEGVAKDRSCVMGWLNAMEKLELILSTNKDLDVRVLRYEDFANPHALCLKLMLFAFDVYPNNSFYADAARDVCDRHFSDDILNAKRAVINKSPKLRDRSRESKSSIIIGRGAGSEAKRHRKKRGGEGGKDKGRRQLRLRSSLPTKDQPSPLISTKPPADYKTLDFSVTSVESSVTERLKSFQKALKKTNMMNQKEILRLEKRLNRFGYSFVSDDILDYHVKNPSVFDKYDIMKV